MASVWGNRTANLFTGEAETYEAFRRHFDGQLALYKTVNVITLTELAGKEKVIGDAYLDNILKYNSQDVTYVTFDFHEYWYVLNARFRLLTSSDRCCL